MTSCHRKIYVGHVPDPGYAMSRLSLFLLLLLLSAPLPGWAEKAVASNTQPTPPPSALSKSLTQEIKNQRQTERLREIQQEQIAQDRARRENERAKTEAERAEIEAITKERALQAEEQRANIRYLEEAAQAREMDRRQHGLWKETLAREAYERKRTTQKERDAYLQWKAQMRIEDNLSKMQAKTEEAKEKALDKQWMQEQKASEIRIEQKRVAQDRRLRAAEARESAQIETTEQRITQRERVEEGKSHNATSQETTRLDMLKKSATQGNPHAQYQLGMMYREGRGGLFQDAGKGFQWLHKAAKQGDARAQLQVGLAYQEGQGVPKDIIAAYLWNQRAVTGGEAGAAGVREALAMKMSPSQLAKAQRLIKEGTGRIP